MANPFAFSSTYFEGRCARKASCGCALEDCNLAGEGVVAMGHGEGRAIWRESPVVFEMEFSSEAGEMGFDDQLEIAPSSSRAHALGRAVAGGFDGLNEIDRYGRCAPACVLAVRPGCLLLSGFRSQVPEKLGFMIPLLSQYGSYATGRQTGRRLGGLSVRVRRLGNRASHRDGGPIAARD